eukprot:g17713.t1
MPFFSSCGSWVMNLINMVTVRSDTYEPRDGNLNCYRFFLQKYPCSGFGNCQAPRATPLHKHPCMTLQCAQLNVTSAMMDDHNPSNNVTDHAYDVALVHESQMSRSTSTPHPKRQKYCREINDLNNQCVAPKCPSPYPLPANKMRSATICKTCYYRMRNRSKRKRLQEGKQLSQTLAEQQQAMKKLQDTLATEVVEKRTQEVALQQLRVENDHLRVENVKLLDEKARYLQKIAALQKPQNEEVTTLRKQYDENLKALMDELRTKTQTCNALENHYKLLAGVVQGLQNLQDLQKPKAQLRPKQPFELSRCRSTTLCHRARLPPLPSSSWKTARTSARTTKKDHTGLSLQITDKVVTCDQALKLSSLTVPDIYMHVVVSKHANLAFQPECSSSERMMLLDSIRDEMFNHITWMVTLNSNSLPSVQKEIKQGR